MMVTEVSDTEVTLDGNHPLAGLDLTFALRLESVECFFRQIEDISLNYRAGIDSF